MMTPAVLALSGLMNVSKVPFLFQKIHDKEEERQQDPPQQSPASHDVKITKADMQANLQGHRHRCRRPHEELCLLHQCPSDQFQIQRALPQDGADIRAEEEMRGPSEIED